MSVDVGNVFQVQPAIAQSHSHATHRTFTSGRWRGQMVSVGCVSVADDFAINFRAARFGMLHLFQHENTGALADDEAVAGGVERTGGPLRVIIPC